MNLGATWVRCNDGILYSEPVWHNNPRTWFICTDDDDPPELVIKAKDEDKLKPSESPIAILNGALGENNWRSVRRQYGAGRRYFHDDFHRAVNYYFEFNNAPLPPTKFDDTAKNPLNNPRLSHYYDFPPWRSR